MSDQEKHDTIDGILKHIKLLYDRKKNAGNKPKWNYYVFGFISAALGGGAAYYNKGREITDHRQDKRRLRNLMFRVEKIRSLHKEGLLTEQKFDSFRRGEQIEDLIRDELLGITRNMENICRKELGIKGIFGMTRYRIGMWFTSRLPDVPIIGRYYPDLPEIRVPEEPEKGPETDGPTGGETPPGNGGERAKPKLKIAPPWLDDEGPEDPGTSALSPPPSEFLKTVLCRLFPEHGRSEAPKAATHDPRPWDNTGQQNKGQAKRPGFSFKPGVPGPH